MIFHNDRTGSFKMTGPEAIRTNYFPIGNELGVKSCVTPYLAGDFKVDQNTFLLEPASIDDLHNRRSARNFWCAFADGTYWSANGNSAENEAKQFLPEDKKEATELEAGFMWHTLTRTNRENGLTSKIVSFVPYQKEIEVMHVTLQNQGEKELPITCYAAIPIYGRSADNLRDHRHVTSMLHRIRTTENGVYVRPTLSFDERGHQKNTYTYFVCGVTENGEKPNAFYPTVSQFIGEEGSFLNPKAVALKEKGLPAGSALEGREAMGAFAFPCVIVKPGESYSYTILMGVTKDEDSIESFVADCNTKEKVEELLSETKAYWQKQVNIYFKTGSDAFDNYMRWVCFQPFLRRIYGCSFLPHHDYGKGGRGWRDLWQDCLALLIMDPKNVGQMIRDNFGGVRIDGTNATIIGAKQGEFIADRNNITRVWMDHGMWPFLTTKLYIEQAGDLELLSDELCYFKDVQVMRGTAKDDSWTPEYGQWQKTKDGEVYKGSVLEHLLIQHILAVCETGENGNILLRGADWNDAIDMANNRGESVAFTCAYAGNLRDIASYVRKLAERNITQVMLLAEFAELIDACANCETASERKKASEKYQSGIQHNVSGKKVSYDTGKLAMILEKLADEIFAHIRENEWVTDCAGNYWYNSYYDDNGRMVEGPAETGVRMMLTGQVFSIMSGVATEEQVANISRSADLYLYEKEIGGYRLNTNFHEEKYDMGRMFGFAYGEKENGAVFSHMAVMYAYALYSRGFVKEGYKALQTLADAALNTKKSNIYPGVPEYFNNDGRGLYHYLTGAASWYALTMVTEVFGVKGEMGNLAIEPKLMPEQFDKSGKASMQFVFGGNNYEIVFVNKENLSYKTYAISSALIGDKAINCEKSKKIVIPREYLPEKTDEITVITVELT